MLGCLCPITYEVFDKCSDSVVQKKTVTLKWFFLMAATWNKFNWYTVDLEYFVDNKNDMWLNETAKLNTSNIVYNVL